MRTTISTTRNTRHHGVIVGHDDVRLIDDQVNTSFVTIFSQQAHEILLHIIWVPLWLVFKVHQHIRLKRDKHATRKPLVKATGQHNITPNGITKRQIARLITMTAPWIYARRFIGQQHRQCRTGVVDVGSVVLLLVFKFNSVAHARKYREQSDVIQSIFSTIQVK